jgi:hypothetical protein
MEPCQWIRLETLLILMQIQKRQYFVCYLW